MAGNLAVREMDSQPHARRVQFDWKFLLIVPVAIALAILVPRLVQSSPATVKQLSIVNNTPYDMTVDVASTGSSGSLVLGTAVAGSTTEFEHVVDQGPVWIVHFAAQGVDGGKTEIKRADLVSADWRIVVPGAVGERLRVAGAPPSPTHS